HSRDYMREDAPFRRSGGPRTWSVVTWLVAINVAVFLLNLLFPNSKHELFGLSIESLKSGRIWTLVTYQFIHVSFFHLLANLLGLFFLGRMLLELTGPRQVVSLYLLGGIAGGLLQLGWNAFFGDANIVGASASVMAIIFAVATLIPFRSIQLLIFFILPVNLTLRQMAWLLVAMNAVTLLLGFKASPGGDGIAVMAHFGGMLWGWAYITLGWHQRSTIPPKPHRRAGRRFGIRILKDGEEPRTGRSEEAKRRPFVTQDVDAILDKINEQGFQSLTEEERRVLEESSQQLSRRIDRER
ncbi:MAG TPA: rhomboid family intramembrane serine protease, partial [Bacteroidia bacterium]|nr:rhomboid family intramembrane serine protease [Bacteroidia bacterium]